MQTPANQQSAVLTPEVEEDELVFTPSAVTEVKPKPKLSLVADFHPVLKEVLPEYDFGCESYEDRKAFADAMTDTMRGTGGVGLSACQVGYKTRMFVMDRIDVAAAKRTETLVCYNPKIIEASDEVTAKREGCLSFPGLALQIKRPKSVKVQFYDEEENEIVLELTDMDAKVFQHELDHLNGILFTTKVKREVLDWERGKQRKLLKKYKKFYNVFAGK